MATLGVSDEESAMFVLGKEQFLLRFDSFYFAEVPSVTTLKSLEICELSKLRSIKCRLIITTVLKLHVYIQF